MYMSHELMYMSHELMYMSHALMYMSHELMYMSHELIYMSLELVYTSHRSHGLGIGVRAEQQRHEPSDDSLLRMCSTTHANVSCHMSA